MDKCRRATTPIGVLAVSATALAAAVLTGPTTTAQAQDVTISTFTPPFGLNIFVGQAIFKVPLRGLYAGLAPFIAISIAALMIVTYVPALSLWILRFV